MRFITKASLLSLLFLSLAIHCRGQKDGSNQWEDLNLADVKQFAAQFTDSLFTTMDVSETFGAHIFRGVLTNDEAKLFPRKLFDVPGKKVAKGFEARNFWLHMEREYCEMFFSIGTHEFSDSFDDMHFDDNGFTTIENSRYSSMLSLVLKRHGVGTGAFVKLFSDKKQYVTKNQIITMERVFADVVRKTKRETNRSILEKNVRKIKGLSEVEQIPANGKFYLWTNRFVARFVVGKKNGKILIVYFLDSDD